MRPARGCQDRGEGWSPQRPLWGARGPCLLCWTSSVGTIGNSALGVPMRGVLALQSLVMSCDGTPEGWLQRATSTGFIFKAPTY